jgi:hypothetical protein
MDKTMTRMKRSKEYAKDILDKYILTDAQTAINTAGVAAIQGLCAEYKQIEKMRNLVRNDGISYNGILSLLKELNTKWLSICTHVNKEVLLLDENGWVNFVRDQMPGLYPNFIKIL